MSKDKKFLREERCNISRIIVLGSGFAGHTAALRLRRSLNHHHTIHVISAQGDFQYTPSLVWVGIGRMKGKRTHFPLAPVYAKHGIQFTLGRAIEVNVEEKTVSINTGEKFAYDYLINATGPYLNFEGTPGLGPATGNTVSICTLTHAEEARDLYFSCLERMKRGEKQTIVVGTGHGGSTCQGAAFEYIQNIHFDLLKRGLRKHCRLIWFSNEPRLGDLGMGGFVFRVKGELRTSEELTEWLMRDCGIETMVASVPVKIEKGKLFWEDAQGRSGCLDFDMAMLIPQFLGQPIRFTNRRGDDLSAEYTTPARFMKVDADYASANRGFDGWQAEDWPKYYRSPVDPALFAAGIAFAPPHPISPPSGTTVSGIKIHAAPPRTGMVAGIIGRVVAENVAALVEKGEAAKMRPLSMSNMPAACIASQYNALFSGSAVMTALFPVVPDSKKYPPEAGGRDLNITMYEIGLANAWIKRILHTMFIYKMKGRWGWSFIPE